MPRRHLLVASALALALVGLAGCGEAGTAVPSPTPSGPAGLACRGLISALPAQVSGQDSRAVLPPSAFTAAWGKDPITLACGVATPLALQADSPLVTINGVDWFVEQGRVTTFTTVNRIANVQISVPTSYAPEASAVSELTDEITAKIKSTD